MYELYVRVRTILWNLLLVVWVSFHAPSQSCWHSLLATIPALDEPILPLWFTDSVQRIWQTSSCHCKKILAIKILSRSVLYDGCETTFCGCRRREHFLPPHYATLLHGVLTLYVTIELIVCSPPFFLDARSFIAIGSSSSIGVSVDQSIPVPILHIICTKHTYGNDTWLYCLYLCIVSTIICASCPESKYRMYVGMYAFEVGIVAELWHQRHTYLYIRYLPTILRLGVRYFQCGSNSTLLHQKPHHLLSPNIIIIIIIIRILKSRRHHKKSHWRPYWFSNFLCPLPLSNTTNDETCYIPSLPCAGLTHGRLCSRRNNHAIVRRSVESFFTSLTFFSASCIWGTTTTDANDRVGDYRP